MKNNFLDKFFAIDSLLLGFFSEEVQKLNKFSYFYKSIKKCKYKKPERKLPSQVGQSFCCCFNFN